MTDEKTTNVSILLRHRIPHLFVPLVTWTCVITLLYSFLFNDMTTSFYSRSLISALNTPISVHLWFLYTLIAIYIISPVIYGGIKNLDKAGHILVISLISLVSLRTIVQILLPDHLDTLLNIDLLSKIEFFGGHLCTFILGYYLGNIKKNIPNSLLIFSAVSLLLIITLGTYWFTIKNGFYDQTFQNQASGFEIILASLIFLIFKQNFNYPCKRIDFKPMVTLTFAIYFIHMPLIDILNRTSVRNTTFVDTLVITVSLFVISYLIMKTATSIKPICFVFTGLSFNKASKSCNWIYTFTKLKQKRTNSDIKEKTN